MSRSFPARRVAAAATVAAAALFAAACSAGQTAQTAAERSTVDGATANAGPIALRNVRVAYPPNARYVRGSSAVLQFSAVNTGGRPDQLVSVTAPVAQSVVTGPGAGQPNATETPSAAPAAGSVDLPPGTLVTFDSNAALVQLMGLTADLVSGQTVNITFTFAKAGSVTVPVPVATPLNEVYKPSPAESSGHE